jgi:uncharacterized protein (DUF1015 family)
MMMCVSTEDSGLVVLPTHRVVQNVEEALLDRLARSLEGHFEVQPFDGSATELAAAILPNGATKIGLHLKGQSYVLTLRPGSHEKDMDAARTRQYNALDVTVLHRLILQNELGIDEEKLAAGRHVSYTIDAEEAVRKVEAGEAGAAFLLRPTPVKQVQEVAAAGDKMPQKSTYFYPKLATGMVLRPLD